ncbi:hypothetical protein [Agromyces allii]|uniref:hypothetical protein n=1 Tax=Agromyces allii TaxID=393607 RepID=UPI0012F98C84|nr:hypothetical protein [Agromyces allii]
MPQLDDPGWQDNFAALREAATTDLELQILEDGQITDEERVAQEDAFVSCTAAAGFTVTEFTSEGGYTIDGPFSDDGPPALTACEGPFNRISGTYWQVKRNPAGEDEIQLMLACLIRAGVIDHDFTAADYMAGLGESPLSISSPEFSRCNAEPTTAFKQ